MEKHTDKLILNMLEHIRKQEYIMGIDTYDKETMAYCLGIKKDGFFEVLLAKTMNDEKEFNEEVQNLVKYFDATTVRV